MSIFENGNEKKSGNRRGWGKHSSLPSLRYSLFFIFAASWLIPIVVLASFIFNQYQNAYIDRTESEVMNAVNTSGSLMKYQLDTATAKLYKQSTGGEWERQYRNMQTGITERNAYITWMRSQMVNTYYMDEQFSCVAFYLHWSEEPQTYTGRNGYEYESYMETVNKSVLEIMRDVEKQTRVRVINGNVYLIQDLFLSTYDRSYATIVVGLRKEELFKDLPLVDDADNIFVELNGTEADLIRAPETEGSELSEKQKNAISQIKNGGTSFGKRGIITTLQTGFSGYGYHAEGKSYTLDLYYLKDMQDLYYEISRLNLIVLITVIGMIPVMILSYYYMKKNSDYAQRMVTKDAQIAALQAQINPHFLNNTLEMMNWQARMNGDAEISKMIEALSTVLDSGINRDGDKLVRLSEELRCADAFLYIMSMRFGQRLNVEKLVDRNVLSSKVPQLILQPILENAIKHGVESVSSGTVWLNIFEEEGNLIIDVINTGKEMGEKDVKRIRDIISGSYKLEHNKPGVHTSIGIYNVNKRIELIYGEEYGLSFHVIDGNKMQFRMIMPYAPEDPGR